MDSGKPEARGLNFYPTPERPIPRYILVGAGLMVLATLGLIGFGQLAGVGRSQTPEVATVASRDLTLLKRGDGAFAVLDADSDEALIEVADGDGAFAIEALRNLDRNRTRKGVAIAAPYTLALKADGRVVLEDPATADQVELRAFGRRQAQGLARFLELPAAARAAPAGSGA